MKLIRRPGLLKTGDKIKIIGKSQKDNYSSVTVKEVTLPGDDREEVIINTGKNYYFITRLVASGLSWVDSVYKLEEQSK